MGMWQMNTWELLVAAGPIMVPIILCSVLALAIVIERSIYFSRIKDDPRKIRAAVFEYMQNNQIREAIVFCGKSPSPVARVLEAGLLKFGSAREEVREALDEAGQMEVPKLEQRLTALNTIAQIAPLLGLLGTVVGIASVFYTIQLRHASMNPVGPGDLAQGMWQAMLTTIAGLTVSIPTHILYNYFVTRVHHLILEMENSACELLNHLSQI